MHLSIHWECKVTILKEMRIAQQCSKIERTLIEIAHRRTYMYNYFEQQSKAFLPKSPISLQSGGQGKIPTNLPSLLQKKIQAYDSNHMTF